MNSVNRASKITSQSQFFKVKPSRRISLDKVQSSTDLENYQCAGENDIIVMGKNRMFFVLKNNDAERTANIVWIQAFSDVQSCTITFDTKVPGGTDVLLDMKTMSGKNRQVRMPDPVSCAKILEIIRQRKSSLNRLVVPTDAISSDCTNSIASHEDRVKGEVIADRVECSGSIEKDLSISEADLLSPAKIQDKGCTASAKKTFPFTSPALIKRKRSETEAIANEKAKYVDSSLDLLPGESEDSYVIR